MDTLNKLKDINLTNRFLDKIKSEVVSEISIMEVCGTHTNVILKNGIKDLLPEKIKLINGPGCPVCVTPQGYIDTAIKLSKKENMIITTFGDLMRVPGKESTLSKEKALGSDIRVVYSPLDSIKIARENPSKEVIFLGIGFETTAPIIAMSIKIACDENINNFSVFNSLKTMPEAMKSLVLNPNIKIDAFLCPGHVATIIGENQFKKLAVEYNIPMVIAGFEVNDILASIYTVYLSFSYLTFELSDPIGSIYNRLYLVSEFLISNSNFILTTYSSPSKYIVGNITVDFPSITILCSFT